MMVVRPAAAGYRPFEVLFDLAEGFAPPSVAYRETFSSAADIDFTHARIMGPKGEFARVLIRFEPLAPASGFVFRNAVPTESSLNEFVAGVERGVRAGSISGSAGFPVIDFMATLLDGATHDVDSSIFGFEIAARAAFRRAIETAEMKLLEPVMKVEVVSPKDCVGTVIGDLNSRRGVILAQEIRGNDTIINAMAPCANLTSFARDLRVATNGTAICSGEFLGLWDAPSNIDHLPPAATAAMSA